jgi:hypothetical protein
MEAMVRTDGLDHTPTPLWIRTADVRQQLRQQGLGGQGMTITLQGPRWLEGKAGSPTCLFATLPLDLESRGSLSEVMQTHQRRNPTPGMGRTQPQVPRRIGEGLLWLEAQQDIGYGGDIQHMSQKAMP